MNKNNCRADIQTLSDFLLDYTVMLMGVGSHTARVVRNATRIAVAFGYDLDVTIFQRNFTMTLKDPDDYSIRRTYVRKLIPMALNLKAISDLSALSWDIHDECLPMSDVRKRYTSITKEPPISPWIVLLAASTGNAAFCRLFGGDIYSILIVFLSTIVGFFLRQQLAKRHTDHRVMIFLCAFASSAVASLGYHLGIGSTPEVSIAVSVLFLIPGVPLINSIIDIIEGHVLVGLSRAINAGIFIVCIALGLYMTLTISGLGMAL